ncbi:MAG: type VI secretion system membrane subunit TssM [Aquabacterium sp.]|uniref:type VI secretion system membrane subunit TssM n=1 Tax=Aquabacterium sp. TaxID=1872578 RepID=UPI0025BB8B2D|nr:type VI secretion system membrane subunit TssM [Aquabacterium sp.]MBI3380482.1 type VI secretion system membrane subunit TssM [Aquabacterium sp.]
MKKLLSFLFSGMVLAIIGLLALSLVIWIVGPLIAIGTLRPLESVWSRLILIGLIVGIYALVKVIGAIRAKKANQAVVNQLLAPAPKGADAAPEAPEVKLLRERFEKGMETLKNARFEAHKGVWAGMKARAGKRYLYELPWYIIIGAPGSGKTTALLNSGLRFPLAAPGTGVQGLPGVAGTRNCDWWFTDQAVLLDTAGRYTTQDSDHQADQTAWNGFLGLLKRARPRQPVNGVLVTVSVPDLLTKSAAERQAQAAAVRTRLQELHEQLGVRFPIYLMVTKCDLLSGFMDTLGELDRDSRATPWGFTFKLDDKQHSDASGFLPEFDALEKRLTDGLIDRLQLEHDPARRARIYAFPQQFGGLRNVLKSFVDDVFSPSQFEANPLIRGVYFISGTQEGTPLDRMLGSIARSYRLERTVLPPNKASGKAFFLERLLNEVVFAESELGGTDLKWERRRGLMALAGYATIGVLATALLVAWGVSFFNNRAYVNAVSQREQAVRALLQTTPNRASSDILVLMPALKATRDLAVGDSERAVPWSLGFGLYQGRKLDSASRQAYERMLVDALLPRIALRVEDQVKTSIDNPELQYEALKAYVMLHDPQHFDPKALKSYFMADWDQNLPRSVTTEQRAELNGYLDDLLAQGPAVSPLPEDRKLVDSTRARLVAIPLAQRVYYRLKQQGVGEDIPEFTVAKAAGNSAALVFMRASGAPLTKGVPGLFTFDGYHKGFQPQVDQATKQLSEEETWVLGVQDSARSQSLRDPTALRRLTDDVRQIYLTEYATIWEGFIADIRMLPSDSLPKAVQMARVLSSPESPLKPLLTALSHETTLSLSESKSLIDKAQDKAESTLDKSRAEIAKLFGDKPAPTAVADGRRIESIVDDRFLALRQMVTSPDGKSPAPIDGTLGLINEVYTLLTATETAVQGGNVPPPSDVPNKIKAEAARLPEPIRSLLNTLSVSGTTAALDATRANLGQAIKSQIGEFCQQAIAGRYPFVRSSSRDVTQDDFARMFAPGGLMDSFFQQQLARFVDTSTRPWSFRKLEGATMGTDSGTLAQFQRAAAIRDTFFRAGGNQPGLRLDFRPFEMDATITQFTLDVDGQLVKYAHGPQIPASVQWPGPRGSSLVRVSLAPPGAGDNAIVTEGPWALFRLFDRMALSPAGAPERFNVAFNVGGRKATFTVTSSSVQNPFRLPELSSFSCPGGL